jgi:hypothetical protein
MIEESAHVPSHSHPGVDSIERAKLALSTILNLPQSCFDRKARELLTEIVLENMMDKKHTNDSKYTALELSALIRFAPFLRPSSRLVSQLVLS